MSRPTIKPGSDAELFRLPIQCQKMGLEIGHMPRTHSQYPLNRDDLPMLAGDKTGPTGPADLFCFSENQDGGNGPGQHFHLAVSGRRSNLKLVKKRIHGHHIVYFQRCCACWIEAFDPG